MEGSPYHYDSHVQLIRLLRQLGDLDGARKARNAMNEVFPLTEGSASVVRACVLHFVHVHVSLELWLEWLKDELPLASVPEASMELRQLFERATEDYLCECRSVHRLMITQSHKPDSLRGGVSRVYFPKCTCTARHVLREQWYPYLEAVLG